MRREQALDKVEQLAFDAVERLAGAIENDEAPVSPLYIKALKDCHAMLAAGMKANPLDEEELEPEELLARLQEMTERVRRRVARKRELELEQERSAVLTQQAEERAVARARGELDS